jgi:DNA polymerase-1
MPEELIPQYQWIKEFCDAFGIPRCEMKGYEADDIIASYARSFSDTTIISSDKDLMQLMNDKVKFLDPQTYLEKTREDVFGKFGVYPEKIVDFLSLTGDASDNVPGVPSIGPKGAAELLFLFESLDGIYENIDRIAQKKKREALVNNKDVAFLSKQLVQLKDDLVCLPVETLRFDQQEREAFLMKWGFKSLLSRLKHTQ